MMRRWIRVTSFLALLLVVPWPAHAIQWGAGTGTSYPTTLDTANNRTNVGGGSCSSATTTNICKEWLNDWQGAVIAIMTELGVLPKGSYADVKTRLNAAVVSGTAGLSSYVAGDLLQASNTTTLARLANVATGNVLLSGGVGVVSAWGKVGLTTHVDGTLPTANGGTGIAYFTAAGPTVARVYTFPDAAATMLYSGGALGTPSSGILTNVTGLPAASVLAGTLGTGAYVMDTTLTLPKLIGGTATTSTLTLQSTSGVGASGADIVFKVGNNGATEAGRILNSGNTVFGGTHTGVGKLEVLTSNTGQGIYIVNTRTSGTNYGFDAEAIGSGATKNVGGFFYAVSGTTNYGVEIFGPSAGANNYALYSDATAKSYHVGSLGLGSGNTAPASLLDLRAGDLTFSGANGQKYVQGRATQLVAVGSGISTKETTIQIPADAIVDAVSVRVKTQPGGTSTVVVTSTTSGDQFQKGASISTVAGTTDPGTKGSPRNYNGVAAQTVTLTFNTSTTDALGEIRVDLVYRTMTPATS